MINAIAIDDEPMALNVIQSLCDQCDFINLQRTFTKPSEALKHIAKFPIDLIFVDIHMPSISGINLVKSLPQNIMVIFTTAFAQYAAASYELNAIEYLVKPINQKRFTQAVNKAHDFYNYNQRNVETNDKYIFIRADFSLVKILLSDILYIEGLADYLKVHVKDRKTIVSRMTMKDMIEKLPALEFVRVHRSYILPFSKIESVKGSEITIGEHVFPIGRTFVEEFFKRYSK